MDNNPPIPDQNSQTPAVTQPQPIQTTQIPHDTPTHHTNKFLVIIIVILLIIIASGASYYLGTQQNKPQLAPDTQPTPTETPTEPTSITNLETQIADYSDWQTFSSQSHNFTVQYPSQFKLFEPTEENEFYVITDNGENSPMMPKGKMRITIEPLTEGTNYTYYKDLMDKMIDLPDEYTLDNPENLVSTDVKMSNWESNGHYGVVYKSTPKEYGSEGSNTLEALIIRGDTLFKITGFLGFDPKNKTSIFNSSYSDTFNQIISTFKPE